MNSTLNQLENYKAIEAVCVKNYHSWTNIKEFRGAFSRFALKVAQLDLILENLAVSSVQNMEHLIQEIELILKQHFDRYFDYTELKNSPLSENYKRIRKSN